MTLSTPLFLATDAQAYEHFMARWSRRLAGPFLDFVGIKGGNRVLDVGCGTGVITAALAERGCTVVGLDASEPYLEGARRDRSHPNIVYELGDARRMSYADASFDACVSALAIDVIPEVDQVVREMRRVTPRRRDRCFRRLRLLGRLFSRRPGVRHGIRARRRNALGTRPAKGATDCLGKRTSSNLARERSRGCSRGADRD